MPQRRGILGGTFGIWGLALFGAAWIILPPAARGAIAPDVVVLCEPAIEYAVTDVGELWRRQTGVPVHVIASPTALLLQQISHRIRSDLVIAQGKAAETAALKEGLIKQTSPSGTWRNRLVVAERAGGAPSAASTPLAKRLATGPIAIVDASVATAGADTQHAFVAIGLWDAMQAHAVGVVGTADASYLLAAGTVRFAVVYATDVAADHALTVAGAVPDDAYEPTLYWVAETSAVLSPETGKFEAFLAEPAARLRLQADGLEVLP